MKAKPLSYSQVVATFSSVVLNPIQALFWLLSVHSFI